MPSPTALPIHGGSRCRATAACQAARSCESAPIPQTESVLCRAGAGGPAVKDSLASLGESLAVTMPVADTTPPPSEPSSSSPSSIPPLPPGMFDASQRAHPPYRRPVPLPRLDATQDSCIWAGMRALHRRRASRGDPQRLRAIQHARAGRPVANRRRAPQPDPLEVVFHMSWASGRIPCNPRPPPRRKTPQIGVPKTRLQSERERSLMTNSPEVLLLLMVTWLIS